MKSGVNNARGFSLAEAMLATLLVLTILGMVAVLMREYGNVSRHADARDRTFDGIQFALAEMAHEAGTAIQIVEPTGTEGSTLAFRRIDPAIERFSMIPDEVLEEDEEIPDEFSDVTWDPRNPAEVMLVRYRRLDSGQLVREVTRGSTISQPLAESVVGMSVEKEAGGYLLLSLSFQEDKRVRDFEMRARVWSQQ